MQHWSPGDLASHESLARQMAPSGALSYVGLSWRQALPTLNLPFAP